MKLYSQVVIDEEIQAQDRQRSIAIFKSNKHSITQTDNTLTMLINADRAVQVNINVSHRRH